MAEATLSQESREATTSKTEGRPRSKSKQGSQPRRTYSTGVTSIHEDALSGVSVAAIDGEEQTGKGPDNTEADKVLPYSVFSPRKKWGIVLLVSASAFFSPLSATIFLPALTDIATDLNVSVNAINTTVTVYMVFQGLSPSIWGSMADVLGRRPLYLITLSIYFAANIGLALTKTYWLLMLLRCVQATGSASMIALSQGTVADLASPSERGGMVSLANSGSQLAPALGPLIGALLGQYLGWHAIFWFLVISSGTWTLLLFMLLPETLRSIVGDGSIEPTAINKPFIHVLTGRKYPPPTTGLHIPKKRSWHDIEWLAPFTIIFREKDIALVLLFGSILYSLTFAIIVTLASEFKDTYGLSTVQDGLCYMSYGFGAMSASFVARPVLDRDFAKVAEKQANLAATQGEKSVPINRSDIRDLTYFPIEKARMRSCRAATALLICACFVYGWCLEYHVHISVPIIMTFLIGFACFFIMTAVSTLVVDCYPDKAASITASNNIVRCCIGAGVTAFISPLIGAIRSGPAYSLLCGFSLVFSVVALWLEKRSGMRWRQERAFKQKAGSEADSN